MIHRWVKTCGRHEIDILQVTRTEKRIGWRYWIALKIFRSNNEYTIYLRDGTKLGFTAEEKEQLENFLADYKFYRGLYEGIKIQRFAYKHGGNG